MSETRDVTELLVDWGNGDEDALEKLTPLVYDELHRLAAGYLRRERSRTKTVRQMSPTPIPWA